MRFETAEQAKAFLNSKPDGKVTIEGNEVTFKQLEGNEETAYIEKVRQPPFMKLRYRLLAHLRCSRHHCSQCQPRIVCASLPSCIFEFGKQFLFNF